MRQSGAMKMESKKENSTQDHQNPLIQNILEAITRSSFLWMIVLNTLFSQCIDFLLFSSSSVLRMSRIFNENLVVSHFFVLGVSGIMLNLIKWYDAVNPWERGSDIWNQSYPGRSLNRILLNDSHKTLSMLFVCWYALWSLARARTLSHDEYVFCKIDYLSFDNKTSFNTFFPGIINTQNARTSWSFHLIECNPRACTNRHS